MKNFLIALLMIISLPGIVGTILVSQIKSIGDSSANESSFIEGMLWILFFNFLFYGWLVWWILL